MAITIGDAISAYKNTAARATGLPVPGGSGGDTEAVQGPSFGSMVQGALKAAVETTHRSDAVSQQAITGKADMTDIVTAVNNAEVALQSVIAIRDKVVSAYQEIMRMPI